MLFSERELVTPPLDDLILPGVTRDSILTLAKEFNQCSVSERYITMKDIRESLMESRVSTFQEDELASSNFNFFK